ncbi:MAG TPA: hypothetical protein VIC71_12270 [Gammaproteobacteria bacterium]
MAIVNFSVPDDVKKAFNRAFRDRNKSAIIADLMRQAVADVEKRQVRAELFRTLTERRKGRPTVTAERIHAARVDGRP